MPVDFKKVLAQIKKLESQELKNPLSVRLEATFDRFLKAVCEKEKCVQSASSG